VEIIVKPNRAQLVEIRNLIEAGHLSPVVEDTLLLKNAREALESFSCESPIRRPGVGRGGVEEDLCVFPVEYAQPVQEEKYEGIRKP
jgi:hypothetical protein